MKYDLANYTSDGCPYISLQHDSNSTGMLAMSCKVHSQLVSNIY